MIAKPSVLFLAAILIVSSFGLALPSDAQEPVELSFQPGRLYEVAFFTITPGKEKEIEERYFSKALPLAQKFGMRPVGTLSGRAGM